MRMLMCNLLCFNEGLGFQDHGLARARGRAYRRYAAALFQKFVFLPIYSQESDIHYIRDK